MCVKWKRGKLTKNLQSEYRIWWPFLVQIKCTINISWINEWDVHNAPRKTPRHQFLGTLCQTFFDSFRLLLDEKKW